MGLFSRKRKADVIADTERTDISEDSFASEVSGDSGQSDSLDQLNTLDESELSAQVPDSRYAKGPFDYAEAESVAGLIDAGALLLPAAPEMKLQFTLDATKTSVIGVVYIHGDSALQLQAFAAPKNKGIWDQVRLDMRTAIAGQGGSSQEVSGPFGKELQARMPLPNTQDFAPHRFFGVDGPRWLLRGTLYGRAGVDEKAAEPLLEIFRKVVVNRGSLPFPPRELLPMSIPKVPGVESNSAD